MATNNNPSDLEFLISCIRNGEIKIDFTKVNSDHGWTNRSKSQIKYKNVLKAHGLEITGGERYTKTADGTTATSNNTAKTTSKRKADGKSAASKKTTKKAKAGDDEGRGEEEKTNPSVPATKDDEAEAETA